MGKGDWVWGGGNFVLKRVWNGGGGTFWVKRGWSGGTLWERG